MADPKGADLVFECDCFEHNLKYILHATLKDCWVGLRLTLAIVVFYGVIIGIVHAGFSFVRGSSGLDESPLQALLGLVAFSAFYLFLYRGKRISLRVRVPQGWTVWLLLNAAVDACLLTWYHYSFPLAMLVFVGIMFLYAGTSELAKSGKQNFQRRVGRMAP